MAKKPTRTDVWEAVFMALEEADGQTLADSANAVMEALKKKGVVK